MTDQRQQSRRAADVDNPMTMDYEDFVAALFTKPNAREGRLAHAAIGIIGEVVELSQAVSRAEALEELGDVKFYIMAAVLALGDDYVDTKWARALPVTKVAATQVLLEDSAAFLDLAKKVWIYGVPIADVAERCCTYLANIRYAWGVAVEHLGFTPEAIEAHNRAKLRKRYPTGGYTDTGAQARADKIITPTQGA